MKQILDNIANLLKVKTIVTLVVIAVFAVLALKGLISPDNVMIVISMVVSFYFGTQHEKQGQLPMAHDLVWDRHILKHFKNVAILTEEEEIVLNEWVNGKSIANTAIFFHMSERKVNYIRKTIRQKYDRVAVYTPELPKRNTRQIIPPLQPERGNFAFSLHIVGMFYRDLDL